MGEQKRKFNVLKKMLTVAIISATIIPSAVSAMSSSGPIDSFEPAPKKIKILKHYSETTGKNYHGEYYNRVDKDIINKEEEGAELYIVDNDNILRSSQNVTQRADALTGSARGHFYVWAKESDDGKYLWFNYDGEKYCVDAYDGRRAWALLSELKPYILNKTSQGMRGGEGISEAKSHYAMDPRLEVAINDFRKRISGIDKNDHKKIWDELINVMYDMNLTYGGGSFSQGDLSDGKTMCDGFTWIVSELLNNTNIRYRYHLRSDNKINPVGYKHILLEIENPNGEWKSLECTQFARSKYDSKDFYKKKIDRMIYWEKPIRRNLPVYVTDETRLNSYYTLTISPIYQRGNIDTSSYEEFIENNSYDFYFEIDKK